MSTLVSLDLETKCNVAGCDDSQCEHALIPHMARITVIGTYWRSADGTEHFRAFRDFSQVLPYLESLDDYRLLGHVLKFDFKMMHYHGIPIPVDRWEEDTSLEAVASYRKVSAEYLLWYEEARKFQNKKLKKGFSHRKGSMHSLKTLAPFFLKIKPFWETPENHDNDEYLYYDVKYPYDLHIVLTAMLREQGTYKFYKEFLLPKTKMFLRAEERGVLLDMAAVDEGMRGAEQLANKYLGELDKEWAAVHAKYSEDQFNRLHEKYSGMKAAALTKLKTPLPERIRQVEQRYNDLFFTAAQQRPSRLNVDSPTQLKWVLKDHFGLDIRDFKGKESTDKEVLELLVAQGRSDVALLLKYREQHKLLSTYYPAYKNLNLNGILHGNFHLTTAVTGRTSSSNPNLQNQPGELHSLFIARPGYKILTKDLSAIEPALIAYYTEDPFLFEVMCQNPGYFHSINANKIFGTDYPLDTYKKLHPDERDTGKEAGLSVLYGARGKRLKRSLIKRGHDWPERRCHQAAKSLIEAWPDVVSFKEELDRVALTEPITNLFGRKRFFEDPSDIYMQAFNSLAQGSASDLLLDGVDRSQREFDAKGIDAHFLMSVHDEGVFEVPIGMEDVCDEIVTRNLTDYKLPTKYGNVPLRVEGKVSDRWEK